MSIETPASNGIIKSLTNGGGFGTSAERRCNFISTAEFHSSSTPYNESQLFPALCISAGGRAGARTYAPRRSLVNVDHRQNSIFANYSSTSCREHAAPCSLLVSVASSHGNIINHSSRPPVASAFLCLRLTTRLSFSITIKSRRARARAYVLVKWHRKGQRNSVCEA